MTTSGLPRLLLALTSSVVLHLLVLAAQPVVGKPPPPPRLDVRLKVPPAELPPPEETPPPVVLDKNTIASESAPRETPPPPAPPPPPAAKGPARLKAPQEQQALRKLAEYILYPQAAIDANLEGTVHLLLRLDPAGTVLQAGVAASSGHPVLDHAAIQAALRAGRIPSGGKTEVILPVTFRLQ